jgi:hypothetical protein
VRGRNGRRIGKTGLFDPGIGANARVLSSQPEIADCAPNLVLAHPGKEIVPGGERADMIGQNQR